MLKTPKTPVFKNFENTVICSFQHSNKKSAGNLIMPKFCFKPSVMGTYHHHHHPFAKLI